MDGSLLQQFRMREVTADDLPWIMTTGYERYGPYDPGRTLVYLLECIRSPRSLFIRSDKAFVIAVDIMPVWRGRNGECHVLLCCAIDGGHWEASRLLKETIRWARDRKCAKWFFGSETDTDVSALAKYVGATKPQHRYCIDLMEGIV